MEVVNIEAGTFEAMLSKFEGFAKRMEYLCRLHGDRDISEWVDNQDVCLLLNISPRTLQTLRDNGTLAYTQISHKMYYKPGDVEKILPVVDERRKQAKYEGKTRLFFHQIIALNSAANSLDSNRMILSSELP
jgi:hypothetical protein